MSRSATLALLLALSQLVLGAALPSAASAATNADGGSYTTGGVIFTVTVLSVLGGAWIFAVRWLAVKRREDVRRKD